MENSTYRTVRLLKNRIYPTFQLHGEMASKKTTAQEGLRLGALVTMDWLCHRLGADAPEELLTIPGPEHFREEDLTLPSLHIAAGYLIDIVYSEEDGVWTLQIMEPDLGSDPGNAEQSRQAVPGRVIETNVAFRIVDSKLECGFQTVISDPDGVAEPAEVYRLAIIRILLRHPDFGLTHLLPLEEKAMEVKSKDRVKELHDLWRNTQHQLPLLVFTHRREKPELPPLPDISDLSKMPLLAALPPKPAGKLPETKAPEAKVYLPYDADWLAKGIVAFGRAVVLGDKQLEHFCDIFRISLNPGDVALLEPAYAGGGSRVFPFQEGEEKRQRRLEQLKETLKQYPRGKTVSFGSITFLSDARDGLLEHSHAAMEESALLEFIWQQKLASADARWQEKLREEQQAAEELRRQLENQRQYQERTEESCRALRQQMEELKQQTEARLAEKDGELAFLRRKLGQPKEHNKVADWVRTNFEDRILMHQRAADLLEEKSARSVDIGLICDALDFLATDYWERRYGGISLDEMNNRCSAKYGRPFEIKPNGDMTIEHTPTEYKIKYRIGHRGKPVETPLDSHLCVGNAPENLLRIYFLHDDDNKLIVIGSLPHHLTAVKIQ